MLIWKNKRGSNRSDEDVKRRSRFESRRFRRYEADEDGSDVDIPKSMSALDKSVGYDEFVEILDANASDPKAKAWLQYAFGKGKKEDGLKIRSSSKYVPAKKCIPTQNLIGVENSLKWAIENAEGKAKESLDNLCLKEAPKVSLGSKIWVYQDGDYYYIIDGHHRWSQAYCFNPDCEIDAEVFTNQSDVKIKPIQILACVQGAIATLTGDVPSSAGKNTTNMLKENNQTIQHKVEDILLGDKARGFVNFVRDNEKVFKKKTAKLSSADFADDVDLMEAIASWLSSNCVALQQNVTKVMSPKSPDREVMPQTDKAQGGATALKNTITKGTVDDFILNVHEHRGIPRAIHKKYID